MTTGNGAAIYLRKKERREQERKKKKKSVQCLLCTMYSGVLRKKNQRSICAGGNEGGQT